MKHWWPLLLLLCFSCNQHNEIDTCIEERIADFGAEICSENATVKKYLFQGKSTYAIHPGNCGADMSDEILDSDCNLLGYLGGFAGTTTINGEDYYANATLEETIWQN
jgi:hypothetical protein